MGIHLVSGLALVASSNFVDSGMRMRRGWIRTLRSTYKQAQTLPKDGFASISVARFILMATDGACIDVPLARPGLKKLTLRLPSRQELAIDPAEMAEICEATIDALQACCEPIDPKVGSAIIARNDAICASIALSVGTSPSEVTIYPPTPFEVGRVVVYRGSDGAAFDLSPEHQKWFLARHAHLEYSHDASDGDILRIGQRTRHIGPSASDPIALMRLLSHLPAGPAIEVPDGAWKQRWGNPPF